VFYGRNEVPMNGKTKAAVETTSRFILILVNGAYPLRGLPPPGPPRSGAISPPDIAGRCSFPEGTRRGAAASRSISPLIQSCPLRGAPSVSVRVAAPSSRLRPNIVGETRDGPSILSARREVQILEANILPSGDEGRIYLHDAPALNPAIHLSARPWTVRRCGGGILFPLALISTARDDA